MTAPRNSTFRLMKRSLGYFKPYKLHISAAMCGLGIVAACTAGAAYLVVGVFGAALVGLFTALPGALIAVVSGLALFGAIASGLTQAMEDAPRREAALVTLLLTVSGVSFFGVGSAFWGLVGGLAADRVLHRSQA